MVCILSTYRPVNGSSKKSSVSVHIGLSRRSCNPCVNSNRWDWINNNIWLDLLNSHLINNHPNNLSSSSNLSSNLPNNISNSNNLSSSLLTNISSNLLSNLYKTSSATTSSSTSSATSSLWIAQLNVPDCIECYEMHRTHPAQPTVSGVNRLEPLV